MPTISYPGTPGTTLYIGRNPPPSGVQLKTLTFENELGADQPGEWFAMFGLQFKKGELAAGQVPHFRTAAGAICAATIWNVTSWVDDGSVLHCSCLIRVPTPVANGGQIEVRAYAGGSMPAANSLTLASASAADIKFEATGVTNLSGVWTCSLNDGITRNNHVVLLGSGDAGSYYKVGAEFRDGSASAHGQLYGWHYVYLLRNAAGGFAGMRRLGRYGQIWADVTTPTTTMRRFTGALKSGGSLVRNLGAVTGTDAYERTEIVGTEIACNHYSTFYDCDLGGEYDYHQSGGSLSADCKMHLRRVVDEFVATKVVPPMDTSLVADAFAGSSSSDDYRPYCKGGASNYDQDSQGEWPEIGVIPGWCASHILTQNKAEERYVRVSGLAQAGYTAFQILVGTKRIPLSVDIRPSYAGMGTIDGNARFYGGAYKNNNPAASANLHQGSDETDHRPGSSYYAYLITGEQQYLDQLVSIANTGQLWLGGSSMGGPTLRVTPPITHLNASGEYEGISNPILNGVTYKGAGYMVLGYLARVAAWYLRDMQQVCAIYPDTCPEGTETRLYFRDVVKSNFDLINAYNAAMVTSWQEDGLYIFNTGPDGPWSTAYMSNAVCLGTTIYPTAEGNQFRQHIGKFWETIAQKMDYACVANYHMVVWKSSTGRIDSVDKLTFLCPPEGACTFNAATNTVTRVGSIAWPPTNGDRLCFSGTYKPFGGTDSDAIYYVVNASGADFQLAATPGGAGLDIVNGATATSDFSMAVADYRPGFAFQNSTYEQGYYANLRSVARFHNACGDDMTAAIANLDRNDALPSAAGIDYAIVPKFAFAKTYPA